MDVQVSNIHDNHQFISIIRPEVQEPAPVTEDQLAELSEVRSKILNSMINLSFDFCLLQVMMQLGTDEAGAEIRAKMQSASLLSDMESFKVSLISQLLICNNTQCFRRPSLAVCWQTL